MKFSGCNRLPNGASDRYPKILEEMKLVRKYVEILSAYNIEKMSIDAIGELVADTKNSNRLYSNQRKEKTEEITRLTEENGSIKKKIIDERDKQTSIQQRLESVNTDMRNI